MENRVKTFAASVKADSAEGVVVAYASTWTRTPDSYGDVVASGAFTETLTSFKQSGKLIPVHYNHSTDVEDIIGSADAVEDETGLLATMTLRMGEPKARMVWEKVRDGLITQMSFAYRVLDEATVELEDGGKANELRQLDLLEVSIVPFGANSDTRIEEVKSSVDKDARYIASKAGRVISAKNEAEMRDALHDIESAAGRIKSVLSTNGDDEKTAELKDAFLQVLATQAAAQPQPQVPAAAPALNLKLRLAAIR